MHQSKWNQNWSANEITIVQMLIPQLGFTQVQISILLPQIQKIRSAEKAIDFLMKYDKDWNQLQENIQREISNPITVENQFKNYKGEFNQSDLSRLKNKLSQFIQNPEDVNCLLQYIQQHYNQEIINKVQYYQFTTVKELLQSIQKVGENSRVNNQRQFYQNTQNQIRQGNNIFQENKQIKDLFTEFHSLNKRSNQQIEKQLIQLYHSLENQKQKCQVYDFTTSPQQLEYEELLNLCITVKQHFSYYPRPVQLLSVIELYNHNDNQGRLSEIYTGEGKTLIVAMLAILLCKKKKVNVDIVTSSPVLAIRDTQEFASFYEQFSISVAHNIDEQKNEKEGMLPCYKSQVIYGDAHSFQADILRHQYKELGTMGNRQQGYIIVDEVDSMLIDGSSNKTLITTPLPGMLDLTKVLRLIWDEICKVEPNLSTDCKVMITDGDGYYTKDLVEYVQETLDKQIADALENQIPDFRLDYINFMKKGWIENAILAKYNLYEKQHYLIENNNVRIIDYQNTGVVHKDNTQWSKGLHQFIQFKHNLPISTLRISTNFMSNVGFFKRYKNQLLGLTGTLGSQVTQNLLAKRYNIDFVFIPPFKKRLLKQEPGIAVSGVNEWFEEIYKAVYYQIEKKRAVLIINRTIDDVQQIEECLKNLNFKTITYFDNNQQVQKKISPNTIIIATNLAGRGTDLIPNEELEMNGGLHVIMSFLPRNIRIQLQGFGRTGRQGKQGTAQLIVNIQTNLYIGSLNEIKTFQDAITYYEKNQIKQNYTLLDVLIYFRDLHEQQYSDEIEQEMDKLENEDKCFQKFYSIAKNKINIKTDRAAFQALEEKWGLYLEQFQEQGLKEEDIEIYLNSKEWQNPKQLIYQAIQHEDSKILKNAAEITVNDPMIKYYQGIFEIQEKDYESGIQSLHHAKELLQKKMDDEEGFGTAAKLNRMQVDQFQEQSQISKTKQSDIAIQQKTQKMPNLNLKNNSKQEQVSAIKLQAQNNGQQNVFDQKIKNHLKVYQKVKDNIDEILNTIQNFQSEKEELELSWMPVIDEEEKKNAESEQCIKDQQEVMEDGPLPKLGKLTKIKKTNWGSYIAMFAIGLCQFIVGCGICACTLGAALPIGKQLATEGISDMIYSVTAAWQGIDIDWKAWGKQKSIKIATALSLAGPVGLSEALKMGGSMLKSLKKIGISEFLRQIPAVTIKGLEKAGYWLTDQEQGKIQNEYKTLQKVQDQTQNANNQNQILNLANEVLENQVNLGVITDVKASEISQIVKDSLEQSKGNAKEFNNIFYQLALKFIRLQMVKTKSDKDVTQKKSDLVEVCEREGTKKYAQIKNDIHQYNQYKQALNNELRHFSNIIWSYFQKDQEVQKMIVFLDLTYELFQDQQKIISNEEIQNHFHQNFNIHNKVIQNACNQLQISNPQSMNQFYQGVMRPCILGLLVKLIGKNESSEPLECLFYFEYYKMYRQLKKQVEINNQNLENQRKIIQLKQNSISHLSNESKNQINQAVDEFNAQQELHAQQVQQFDEIKIYFNQQIAKQIIGYMKMNRMINDDGISFSPKFQEKFYQYLNNQKFNQNMREVVEQSMLNSLKQIPNLKFTLKKLSSKFKQGIEVEIIDVVKKYIFDQKIQIADQKLSSKLID